MNNIKIFVTLLAYVGVIETLLEAGDLSDSKIISMFILTILEICYFDYCIKKAFPKEMEDIKGQ
jgi:hypothetical protein